MEFHLSIDGRDVRLDIAARRPVLRLAVDGAVHEISGPDAEGPTGPGSGRFAITVDGRVYRGWRHVAGDDVFLRIDGRTHHVTVDDGRGDAAGAGAGGDDLCAEMPGIVVAVHCGAGDVVARGDALLTIESMKLQTTIIAPRDGAIARLHAPADTAFGRGDVLVSLAPADTLCEG
ncbi:acetyl-CoA carboxylase biotin carboxyl carrier protein subunit (plasmid) [Tistrella bauzanensis]|uniref:biotin/lipoyl-containing protein n=1 Tax=Tistrella TaxID=171436 RepID=UPI0031F68BA5